MEALVGIVVILFIVGVSVGLYFWMKRAPAGHGTVDVRVTDKVEGNVTSVVLTVSDIRASVSPQDTTEQWTVLVSEPKTFDLIQVKGIEDTLGTKNLPSGQYQQIRMTVNQCKATIDGATTDVEVPSGVLKLVKPFIVQEGRTTVVTLDFDANESLVQAGQKLHLKPVIKLLVRDSAQPFDVSQTFSGQ